MHNIGVIASNRKLPSIKTIYVPVRLILLLVKPGVISKVLIIDVVIKKWFLTLSIL